MYNEERKIRFLEETRSSDSIGKAIFNGAEPYEVDAGKDICELTIDVLQPMMNMEFGVRTRSVNSYIEFLRSYVNWCSDEGYKTVNDVYEIKTEMDEKVRRMMVASPKHLESILENAFDSVQSETVDCLYRCFIWMCFAGMKEDEALDVTVNEVDFDSMMIEHNGRSYEIYREAVLAFKMACSATQFKYVNPNYSDEKKDKYRNRYPGTYLMRGIRSEKINIKTVRALVGKKFRELGIETTFGKIRLSGMYYRTYEMERIGMPVNFDGYIAERLEGKEHNYNKNHTRNKLANSIRRDLVNDYECWKSAFTK